MSDRISFNGNDARFNLVDLIGLRDLVDPTLTGWVDNAKDNHRSRFLCREGMKTD